MSLICPTVTAYSAEQYGNQLDLDTKLSSRVHLDLMDGDFAEPKSINLAQVWWPEGLIADIHLMYRHPAQHLESLVSLHPSLVIIHAEADGDLAGVISHLKKFEIKTGLALLKPTQPNNEADLISMVDHVLIFSGDLGKFGGKVDFSMLDKIAQIKKINSQIEIGWDGGANAANVSELAGAGIDVINVGGALQQVDDPQAAYAKMVDKIG